MFPEFSLRARPFWSTCIFLFALCSGTSLAATQSLEKASSRPALSCTEYFTPTNDSRFEDALAATRAAVEARVGNPVEVIIYPIHLSNEPYRGALEYNVVLRFRNPDGTILNLGDTNMLYGFHENGALHVDFHVDPGCRRLGFTNLVRAHILKKHPEVKLFSNDLFADNLSGFLSHFIATEKKPDFKFKLDFSDEEIYELYKNAKMLWKRKATRALMRNRAIRSYQEFSLAGKTNARLGFNRLLSLNIRIGSSDGYYPVQYVVERGDFDPELVKIEIIDNTSPIPENTTL